MMISSRVPPSILASLSFFDSAGFVLRVHFARVQGESPRPGLDVQSLKLTKLNLLPRLRSADPPESWKYGDLNSAGSMRRKTQNSQSSHSRRQHSWQCLSDVRSWLVSRPACNGKPIVELWRHSRTARLFRDAKGTEVSKQAKLSHHCPRLLCQRRAGGVVVGLHARKRTPAEWGRRPARQRIQGITFNAQSFRT